MTKIPKPKRGESTLIVDVNPLHRLPLVFVNLAVFAICCIVAFVCVVTMVDRFGEISFRDRSLLLSFMVNLEITALIVSGVLLVISFTGFVGALRENVCLLRWYLNGLTLLIVINGLLAVGAVAIQFLSKNSAKSLFSIEMIESYRDNLDYARLVDYVQTSFECCGLTTDRYRDWNRNIYFNCSKSNPSQERCSVPASCCRPPENQSLDFEARLKRRFCGRSALAMTEQQAWNKIFTRSCVDAAVAFIQSNVYLMVGILLVVSAVLAVLRCMAGVVHDEVIELTRLYDDYYKKQARGARKSQARLEALREVTAMKHKLVHSRHHRRHK
ncbi:tetraspanin-33-like [Haemaphysalis longicornis]